MYLTEDIKNLNLTLSNAALKSIQAITAVFCSSEASLRPRGVHRRCLDISVPVETLVGCLEEAARCVAGFERHMERTSHACGKRHRAISFPVSSFNPFSAS